MRLSIRRPTEVAEGSSLSTGGRVAVVNAGHVQQLLGHRCTDNASATGCWDQTHKDTATLASHLTHTDRWSFITTRVRQFAFHEFKKKMRVFTNFKRWNEF